MDSDIVRAVERQQAENEAITRVRAMSDMDRQVVLVRLAAEDPEWMGELLDWVEQLGIGRE